MPVPASSGGGRGCVVPRITFIHPQGLSGEVAPNTSILKAAETLGFPLPHDCGGNACCTTCRVEVQSGGENLSEVDFDEQDLLNQENLTETFNRLGSQVKMI